MLVRLQVRQQDGRIQETVLPNRQLAEAQALRTSRAFSTEAWVVGTDGANPKHYRHGALVDR